MSTHFSPYSMHRSLKETPRMVTSTSGCHITLDSGKKILDGCGGAAVVSVGYANKEIVEALHEQLQSVHYLHSLAYSSSPVESFSDELLESYKEHFSKVYCTMSGSEANEAALKMAIQYFNERGLPQKSQFISRKQSYHGNTLGCLSASGNQGRRVPFQNYLSHNFHFVSPAFEFRYKSQNQSTEEYVEFLAHELDKKILELGAENVAAFVAETVVGATAGCVTAPKGYFKRIKAVCDKHDVLLILDEVMCGSGRTGTFFAFEQEEIYPDIVTCGKSVSSGYSPLSICVASHKIIDAMTEGTAAFSNGHTFQAFALSCRSGLEVLKLIKRDNLLENVTELGEYLGDSLRSSLSSSPIVGDIRGRGLFWGIEFVKDKTTNEPFTPQADVGGKIKDIIFENGLAVYPGHGTINGTDGDHIILAPMYISTKENIDEMVSIVTQSIEQYVAANLQNDEHT